MKGRTALNTAVFLIMTSHIFHSRLTLAASTPEEAPPPSTSLLVKVRECEVIKVEKCVGIGYNYTGLPNFVGQDNQEDAVSQLMTFMPLIQVDCSSDLLFFLCSVFAPMCSEHVVDIIGPCRSVCERVRESCAPILQQFGFPWPDAFDCSKFNERNDDNVMCMEGGNWPPNQRRVTKPRGDLFSGFETVRPDPRMSREDSLSDYAVVDCQHLSQPDKYVYVNRSRSCALLCDEQRQFTSNEKHSADVTLAVVSAIGLLSTIITVVSFLFDIQRFRYPERLFIVMSVCYGMCSTAYMIRAIMGRKALACTPITGERIAQQPAPDVRWVLAEDGLASTDCTVVFALIYYFSMAGTIWWVVLSLTWLISGVVGWNPKAIAKLGTIFHIIAWSFAATMTIIVLVRKQFVPNELIGMCQLCTGDVHSAATTFELAPLAIFFVIGMTSLVGGCVGRCLRASGSGQFIKKDSTPAELTSVKRAAEDERAMRKIGLYCFLCSAPLAGLIACHVSYLVTADVHVVTSHRSCSTSSPSVVLQLIQIFLGIVTSALVALWIICSADTIRAWKHFFSVVFLRHYRRDSDVASSDGFRPSKLSKNNDCRALDQQPSVQLHRELMRINCANITNCRSEEELECLRTALRSQSIDCNKYEMNNCSRIPAPYTYIYNSNFV